MIVIPLTVPLSKQNKSKTPDLLETGIPFRSNSDNPHLSFYMKLVRPGKFFLFFFLGLFRFYVFLSYLTQFCLLRCCLAGLVFSEARWS